MRVKEDRETEWRKERDMSLRTSLEALDHVMPAANLYVNF